MVNKSGGQSRIQRTAAIGTSHISSSDQLVRDIVRGLYEGRYVAGQRLVEPDLMERYEVSRSTVREALKRLTAEGMVTFLPFRGAQVRHLSRKEARDVLAILEVNIGLAARLAAENIRAPGAATYFQERYQQLAAFEGERDSYELVLARNRFYRAMIRVGSNADLERLLFGFQIHLIRTHIKQARKRRFADYRFMAEAILSGDTAAAEAAGRAHIVHINQALAEAPDNLFAPLLATNGDNFESEGSDYA